MNLSRRHILTIGGAALTVSLVPVDFAKATPDDATERLNIFTGGAVATDGDIELTLPEIAENGNSVQISVFAPGAVSIMLISEGNPGPGLATYHFGDMAEPTATTRVRLAVTQNVVAVAKLADGSFIKTARAVKVTIGGCGD